MYKFVDKYTVKKYTGEILKIFNKDKLVKTISNPTEEDLFEFGYKQLKEDMMPEYDSETQYLNYYYEDDEKAIIKKYSVLNYETEEE